MKATANCLCSHCIQPVTQDRHSTLGNRCSTGYTLRNAHSTGYTGGKEGALLMPQEIYAGPRTLLKGESIENAEENACSTGDAVDNASSAGDATGKS